ncbi:MAG: Fe-S cluster assembly protein SufD, partial [Bacteroidetes bacterium]|nr:Fe-S cluster assembly protein SufD [Bacteroidota bacterium]
NLLSQQRNLIVAGKDSHISIIDSYNTIGNNYNFLNTVTEIYAGENSQVHYCKIQNDGDNSIHVGTTQVQQEKNSHFNSATVSWGGNITRNNLNSFLNGMGCECHMYGAFILSGEQHVDNHTLVDHAAPNCYSNELYKGILDDNSTGVFNGKVMVRKDAQKTNAYQSNKNILLTDTATMNTKPQLEIFADDVKCSHGATTGQLNKEELFYLRTRGIDKDEARAMLLYAFASEVIQTIEISPLRNILFDKLNEKLMKGK